jgi:hypothetical protein
MKAIKHYLLIGPLFLCLGCAHQLGVQATESAESGNMIVVEMTPMSSPLSTIVTVRENGLVQAVEYSRYKLTVTSRWEGQIANDVRMRLTRHGGSVAFIADCHGQNFGGGGLTRGDQFQVTARFNPRATQQCLGFIEDAPESVRQFVDQVLGLIKQVPRANLAAGYVRSETLTAERLSAIRRLNQMRQIDLKDIARDLRPAIDKSIQQSREFVPLSRQEYEALASLVAPARDFVLATNEFGYQLTIFQSQ